jgi:hypothetical protein
VVAIHRLGKGQRGLGAGARERLGDGRRDALALALPHRRRPGRLAQLARGQGQRLGQQPGVGQRAQRKAHAVAAGAGAEVGAQVGPGLAQLVFVQRRLAAQGRHALAGHQRGGVGQAGLRLRVAPAAGVEVDLHVEHGMPGLSMNHTCAPLGCVQCSMGMAACAARRPILKQKRLQPPPTKREKLLFL